jgi:hypothetical protein
VVAVLAAGLAIAAAWADSPVAGDPWLRITLLAGTRMVRTRKDPAPVNTRTLRRTRKQAASTLEEVSDKMTAVADALRKGTEKAGGELRAELAALPEQLEEVRRSVLAAAEPYRPPKRYRPYVQLGVLVAATATAIVMWRRHAA